MTDSITNIAHSVRQRLLNLAHKSGQGNSRMKDFADLWFLARHFDFDGELLGKAISGTFQRRQTPLQAQPVGVTSAFARYETKQVQWKTFLRRSSPEGIPADFAEVVDGIAAFLLPVLERLAAGKSAPGIWNAAGPWQV